MNRTIALLLLASVLLTTLWVAAPAEAHTQLSDSEPADSQSLTQSPEALALTFGDPVRLMRLNLTDSDGQDIELDYRPDAQPGTDHHHHRLPESLPAGDYTLKWTAMADDGHRMSGQITFSIE